MCMCEKVQVCVTVCVSESSLSAIPRAQGPFQKGLILQGNLSFSQQRQTWQWGKSTLPWWSWSTTGRARSSARRLFVMSRYCRLKEKKHSALPATDPFKVKGRLTLWNQGCRAVFGLWQPRCTSREKSSLSGSPAEQDNLAIKYILVSPIYITFPTAKSVLPSAGLNSKCLWITQAQHTRMKIVPHWEWVGALH